MSPIWDLVRLWSSPGREVWELAESWSRSSGRVSTLEKLVRERMEQLA